VLAYQALAYRDYVELDGNAASVGRSLKQRRDFVGRRDDFPNKDGTAQAKE
jgi:hypothetical protein